MRKFKIEITEEEIDEHILEHFSVYKYHTKHGGDDLIYVDYETNDGYREYFRGNIDQVQFFVKLMREFSALEEIPIIDLVVTALEKYLEKQNVD